MFILVCIYISHVSNQVRPSVESKIKKTLDNSLHLINFTYWIKSTFKCSNQFSWRYSPEVASYISVNHRNGKAARFTHLFKCYFIKKVYNSKSWKFFVVHFTLSRRDCYLDKKNILQQREAPQLLYNYAPPHIRPFFAQFFLVFFFFAHLFHFSSCFLLLLTYFSLFFFWINIFESFSLSSSLHCFALNFSFPFWNLCLCVLLLFSDHPFPAPLWKYKFLLFSYYYTSTYALINRPQPFYIIFHRIA